MATEWINTHSHQVLSFHKQRANAIEQKAYEDLKTEAGPSEGSTSWWSAIGREVIDYGVAIYTIPLLFYSAWFDWAGMFDTS